MISNAQFRVIGYVHPWKVAPDMTKISFNKITHLNIAFVNPDSAGNLVIPAAFDSLIKTAHQFNVKVLASIGGGSHNPYYASLLNDTNRAGFIDSLVNLAVVYNLDGIDVDIENETIDSNYEKLVVDLSRKLKPLKKLLTSAVATWNGDKISDAALKKFDFINVMSYDQTGPWTPDKPGPHSTYEKAVDDLNYWINTRKISKKKINLGLPFYGYCFGTQYGASMSYAEIINTFPGAELLDEIAPPTGGNIYYNGLPTIKKKTTLALKKAGGVMVWQLMQDDMGSNSLLNAIDVTIKK
ncbi:MAG: glycosyl hydrolase family 18 protein [Bacteroidota bacterium]